METVILVEGASDRIALEALAARLGRDLAADDVAIIPMGGAHSITRVVESYEGRTARLLGLCDAGEQALFAAALEPHEFFVCLEDLEDELIRAAGRIQIERVLDTAGDLRSFRTLQKQPAWSNAPFEAQMRRFLGAGSQRKHRYARLLVQALDLNRVPRPLDELLSASI